MNLRIFIPLFLIIPLLSCNRDNSTITHYGTTIIAFSVNDTFWLAADTKRTISNQYGIVGYEEIRKIDTVGNNIFCVGGLSSLDYKDYKLDLLSLFRSCLIKGANIDSALSIYNDSIKYNFYNKILINEKAGYNLYSQLGDTLSRFFVFTSNNNKPDAYLIETYLQSFKRQKWVVFSRAYKLPYIGRFQHCLGYCDEYKYLISHNKILLDTIERFMIKAIRETAKKHIQVGENVDIIKFYQGKTIWLSDTIRK